MLEHKRESSETICKAPVRYKIILWGEEIVQLTTMIDPAQVLIGSILGDGSLSPLSKKEKTSTLDISQNINKLPYLKWLYKILDEILDLNSIIQKKGFEQIYRFKSKPSKLLGDLRNRFYSNQDGRKIIPLNIKELLKDAVSLAVWYMDDGNLDMRDKYHFNSSIASYCFTFCECNILKETLRSNFRLNVSVNKTTMRGKVYPRIYIKSESMERFMEIITPYIHSVFNYKIGK